MHVGSRGVMVSTQDFESCDPSSNLGGTWDRLFGLHVRHAGVLRSLQKWTAWLLRVAYGVRIATVIQACTLNAWSNFSTKTDNIVHDYGYYDYTVSLLDYIAICVPITYECTLIALSQFEHVCICVWKEGAPGFEPGTSRSAVECSTTELYPHGTCM